MAEAEVELRDAVQEVGATRPRGAAAAEACVRAWKLAAAEEAEAAIVIFSALRRCLRLSFDRHLY